MTTPTLADLIATWQQADAVFQSLFAADGEDHDPEWQTNEAAESAVVYYPCATLDDVRTKVRVALSDENVFDSISNCTYDGEPMIYGFLRSLLGESGYPAEKGGDT